MPTADFIKTFSPLRDSTVLIRGADGRNGEAIATLMIDAGARVALWGSDELKLRRLEAKLRRRAAWDEDLDDDQEQAPRASQTAEAQGELSEEEVPLSSRVESLLGASAPGPAEAGAAVAAVIERWNGLDVYVDAADRGESTTVSRTPYAPGARTATTAALEASANHMAGRGGGSIVAVTSLRGIYGRNRSSKTDLARADVEETDLIRLARAVRGREPALHVAVVEIGAILGGEPPAALIAAGVVSSVVLGLQEISVPGGSASLEWLSRSLPNPLSGWLACLVERAPNAAEPVTPPSRTNAPRPSVAPGTNAPESNAAAVKEAAARAAAVVDSLRNRGNAESSNGASHRSKETEV